MYTLFYPNELTLGLTQNGLAIAMASSVILLFKGNWYILIYFFFLICSRQRGGEVAVLQGSVRKVPTSYNAKKTTSNIHYWLVFLHTLVVCCCGSYVVRLLVCFFSSCEESLKCPLIFLCHMHTRAHTHSLSLSLWLTFSAGHSFTAALEDSISQSEEKYARNTESTGKNAL